MSVWNLKDIATIKMSGIQYWPAGRQQSVYDYENGRLAIDNTSLGDRALMLGGQSSPANQNVIDYIQTRTTGQAVDFGDLTRTTAEAVSNNDWTIATHNMSNVIDFINMSSTGNATDFGDEKNSVGNGGNWSSNVRGFSGIGTETPDISSFVFSTKGNSEEWSDLSTAGTRNHSGSSSNTRAVITGTFSGSDPGTDDMLDFSLAHQGIVSSFGDLTAVKTYCGGASSGTRGLAAGGNVHPSNSLGTIDTFNFNTRGNGSDFGDLTSTRSGNAGVGSGVHAVFMGGHTRISGTNTVKTTIDRTIFSSTGSCEDFGDLTVARQYPPGAGQSNGHLHDYLAHQYLREGHYPDYEMGNMIVIGPGDSALKTISYANVMTKGNATEFGDTTSDINRLCGMGADATKAVFSNGYDSGNNQSNGIEYVMVSSKGNSASWGDSTITGLHSRGFGNTTRGVFSHTDAANRSIDYITWATLANAVDFGDGTEGGQHGAHSSSTRGLMAGGTGGSAAQNVNVVEYVTIGSTGNTTDFGDLSGNRYNSQGCGSDTRALFGGGSDHPAGNVNTIDYFTIASTGDASDFGDLTVARVDHASAGNRIRGLWVNGNGDNEVMDFVTVATTGNAADFGDVFDNRRNGSAACNGHGGLH